MPERAGTLKVHLNKRLRDSIGYFLEFSDIEVLRPGVVVLDKTDNDITTIALQFAITADFKLEDPIIIANEIYFENDAFEVTLCHELGHLIDLSRKLYVPSNNFFSLLRGEVTSDREGFRLYVLSGRRNWKYCKLFINIFNELLSEIIKWNSNKKIRRSVKSFIINIIRFLAFLVYKHAYQAKFKTSNGSSSARL